MRGGAFGNPIGEAWPRNIVIAFPSFEAVVDCFHSPEHRKAIEARGDGVEMDHIIVEGYDGPQP